MLGKGIGCNFVHPQKGLVNPTRNQLRPIESSKRTVALQGLQINDIILPYKCDTGMHLYHNIVVLQYSTFFMLISSLCGMRHERDHTQVIEH